MTGKERKNFERLFIAHLKCNKKKFPLSDSQV